MSDQWIWLSRWDDFQHYSPERDRAPAWIKQYTKQLDDDRYTDLSPRRRALLHDLRLAFARTSGRLSANTRTLSRRTFSQVFRSDLESLSDAGFIEFVSRESLEERLDQLYASRAPARSKEEELQQQYLKASKGSDVSEATPPQNTDEPAADEQVAPREREVMEAIEQLPGHDKGTFAIVWPYTQQLTTNEFRTVVATTKRRRAQNKPGLFITLLQKAADERRHLEAQALAAAVEDLPPSPTELLRRNPDEYIDRMATHLTQAELLRYLLEHAPTERHPELRERWETRRAEAAA